MLFILSAVVIQAQDNSVSIGTTVVKANAVLWLKGNGSQGLLLPVVTNVNSINTPDEGMIVYQDSDGKIYYRNASAWVEVGAGGGAALPVSTSGQILVNNGTSLVGTDMTGDVTIDNTGATTIGVAAVGINELADNSVGLSKIQNDAVDGAKIANNAVGTTKIAHGGNNQVLITDGGGAVAWIDQTSLPGSTELADGVTITGNGTVGNEFTVDGAALTNVNAISIGGELVDMSTTPTDAQVLKYDGPNNRWIAGSGTPILNANNLLVGDGSSNTQAAVGGDLTKASGNADFTVTGIQGQPIGATTPSANQVLQYNAGQWAAATLPVATGDMTAATYDPGNVAADVFDRANHTGTQTASTISDFNTAADARIAAASVTDLSDVNVNTPVDDQVLQYASGEWVNASLTDNDNQTATQVPVTPQNGVTSTETQAALEELQGEITANVTAIAGKQDDVMTTQGDIVYHDGTSENRLGIGSDGQVLTVASGTVDWADPSTGWSLGGTAGTVDGVVGVGTNFIGTTDLVPLKFVFNNQFSGIVEGSNTALGADALTNTTNNFNTAFGALALNSNVGGSNNTAIGNRAMRLNVSGTGNAVLGYSAAINTQGSNNLALGSNSLLTNTTGNSNTAVGSAANVLSNNLTNATAIGAQAAVNQSNSLILGSINGVNGATANTFVGIGTTTPNNTLQIASSTDAVPLYVTTNASGAANETIRTQASGATTNTGVTGEGVGGNTAEGLRGQATSATGSNIGVYGTAFNSANSGDIMGVRGNNAGATTATNSYGLHGSATNTGSQNNFGIYATASGATNNNYAGYFVGNTVFDGDVLLPDNDRTNIVTLKAPDDVTTDYDFILPPADGTNGQALTTDGSGHLSWSSLGGAATLQSAYDGGANITLTNGSTPIVVRAPGGSNDFEQLLALSVGDAAGGLSISNGINNDTQFVPSFSANTTGTNPWRFSRNSTDSPPFYFEFQASENGGLANQFRAIVSMSNNGGTRFNFSAAGQLSIYPTQSTAIDVRPFGVNPGNTSQLEFRELAANGNNVVGFKSPDALANDVIMTLPEDNSAGVLTNDGAGVLSWGAAGSSPFTQGSGIVFNNSTDQIAIGTSSLPASYKFEVETPADASRAIAMSVDQNYNGVVQTFGIISDISNAGTGEKFGTYNLVSGNAAQTNPIFGTRNQMSKGNTENVYGIYNTGEDYNYFSGSVGIGTTTPAYPLDIEGAINAPIPSGSRYFNSSVDHLSTGPTAAIVSIRATGAVWLTGTGSGVQFAVSSDERIKRILGVSDSKDDLSTLMKLKVTDYQFIDSLASGDLEVKGVIAQEVEAVYPQAISQQTNWIPNIYTLTEDLVFDTEKQILRITMDKAHGLIVGDKVKLITESGEEKPSEVYAVDGNSFTVANWTEESDRIFVFGKEINDFRVVDYDKLFTLNVSATQELVRMINGQEARIAELEKQIELTKTENTSLKASVASPEQLKAMKAEIMEEVKAMLGVEAKKE